MMRFLSQTYLFLFLGSNVSAQEISNIQTDRPDQTETPFTVPKYHFQSENGFNYEKVNDSETSLLFPAMLFKFGLTETFEFGVISELTSQKFNTASTAGLTPLTLRVKQNICKEKGIIPTTSFIGYLGFPNASSKSFKTTYFAPAFRFTMQHTLSEKLSLGYNLGAEWDGETPEPSFLYTLTTGISITNKVGAYIELYGFTPQKSKADHRADGGFTYLVKKNIQLDLSGGIGLSQNSPDYFGSFGFSFRLKN